MNLRSIASIPLALLQLITRRSVTSSNLVLARNATTMVTDPSKMSVLHGPLQPHSIEGDTTHPTGFQRDGYCWGSKQDPGSHYIAGVVTTEFLQFSKERGNDLMTPHPGRFPGLKDGCRWCLCVARWKEAFQASGQLGDKVVPRVDLSATALEALKSIKIEDLRRFEAPPRQ